MIYLKPAYCISGPWKIGPVLSGLVHTLAQLISKRAGQTPFARGYLVRERQLFSLTHSYIIVSGLAKRLNTIQRFTLEVKVANVQVETCNPSVS